METFSVSFTRFATCLLWFLVLTHSPFSSEFQNLKFLRVLDLSHNGLTGIADNLIKGCEGLKVEKMCMTLPAGNG